ncbi:MAG: gluconate 2-dehydrogenase subunit 3 family protein [Rhizomicrobium sp.]
MSASDPIRLSRRTTLAWFGAAAALSGFPPMRAALAAAEPQASVKGYGRDPDLLNPFTPWPRTMTPDQLRGAATLADLILPPVDGFPAPSAVGIADFIDEWVSAPYPDQLQDRAVIVPGLDRLNERSRRQGRKAFWEAGKEMQRELLADLAAPPAPGMSPLAAMQQYLEPATPASKQTSAQTDPTPAQKYQFFLRFRSITVSAYYSMERNFPEIGYIGNVARESYPPMTEEEIAFVERAAIKLGL